MSDRPARITIRCFRGLVNGYIATYWVGMARPADAAPDDFEMVEVTGRYVTKAALLAAHPELKENA